MTRPPRTRRSTAKDQLRRRNLVDTAIETVKSQGLTVEPIDEQLSLVAGRFEWHRSTHRWKDRESASNGYGLTSLIAAAKGPAK